MIALLCSILLLPLPFSAPVLAAPGDIQRCSSTASGTPANNWSHDAAISADGRYAVFYSEATNLVHGDTNGKRDIFRKDLQTGAVVRCSTSSSWAQANGDSEDPAISADGRYVAFRSNASDLVPGGTTADRYNVYRKDMQTGAVVLCSADSSGTEGNNDSHQPAMTPDGRFVAFHSWATNLMATATSGLQVFRKDLQTGAVALCSSTASGVQGDDGSDFAAISADGRFVAFRSFAANLAGGGGGGFGQVFRKDLQSGALASCSASAAGTLGNGGSYYPVISADGRFVAFASEASNLVGGDTNGVRDTFRKDMQTSAVALCSASAAGTPGNGESGEYTDISADGRFVALDSQANNLVPLDTNGKKDVFRKDAKTGAVVRCSTDASGTQGNGNSEDPAISADGRFAAFESVSSNLLGDGFNTVQHIFRKELALPAPVITSIDPGVGAAGTEVTLGGLEFGASRGESFVSFGVVRAMDYISWSDTQIKVKVPEGLAGAVQVTVTTEAGTSNFVVFAVPTTFYFAEGYTGEGFHEYLCLGQPVNVPQDVTVTYMFNDGSGPLTRTYSVPALSRLTVNVNEVVGPGREVSMRCEADFPFIAERPMYFNYGGAWTGGHNVVGAPGPASTWSFAEGYTGPGFDEWICVLNPGDAAAALTFLFQTQEKGEVRVEGMAVPARSRGSFKANDLLGGIPYQTSLVLESSQPVVAERAMYFSYAGIGASGWTGGHCVMGASTLATEYFFAEGTTRKGFEEWLTLQNPGLAPITVKATYLLAEGEPVKKEYTVEPARRFTVYVEDEVGPGKDVSVHLTCDHLFLAERPMYFDYQGLGVWGWTGGHCVIGATSPATEWFLAEGYTGDRFEEWICIQNPGAEGAMVRIVYFPEGGIPIEKVPFTVAGNSRYTVPVNEDAGAGLSISAMVTADRPVIVERPMYFSYGPGWTGGHDVVGFTP